MIAMVVVFGMFLFMFGLIGAVRGWAKEMLVIFSVILALAVISLVEDLLGFKNTLFKTNPTLQYLVQDDYGLSVGFLWLPISLAAALQNRYREARSHPGPSARFYHGCVQRIFCNRHPVGFRQPGAISAPCRIYPASPPELSHITDQVLNLLPPVWLDQPTTIFIFVVVAFIFAIMFFL